MAAAALIASLVFFTHDALDSPLAPNCNQYKQRVCFVYFTM